MKAQNRLLEGITSLLGAPEEVSFGQPCVDGFAFFSRLPGVEGLSLAVSRGLSRHSLHQRTRPPVRQEIMVICESSSDRIEIAALLLAVAKEVAEREHAIEKGEVFGPAGELVSGSEMTAFFATEPMFLPPSFCRYSDGPDPLLGVWLLAISSDEAVKARELGPDAFQSYLATIGGPESFYGFRRKATGLSH